MTSDPNAWRLARVVAVDPETPRAVTVRFAVPGWPGHLAGQRIDVRLTAEDGYSATRAYSMAAPWPGSAGADAAAGGAGAATAAPAADRGAAHDGAVPATAAPAAVPGATGPTVDVTVEELEDGEVSPYLARELRPGDELEVRGPIGGAFTWQPGDGGPVLLVAGGSGLVPLMAMVRANAAAGGPADMRLLLSARRGEDVLYAAELRALASAGTIALLETLTRETPNGWTGATRRIDGPMLAELGPPPGADPTIFVCGSNPFVEAAVAALLALGHDAGRIRTERFGPSAT